MADEFQSHNGAIAASPTNAEIFKNLLFQSHNGAIAAVKRTAGGFLTISFQSHNGAIAASTSIGVLLAGVIVSIPQWCDCCPLWRKTPMLVCFRFNPTMVRLLPTANANFTLSDALFQSHNGAIAAQDKG